MPFGMLTQMDPMNHVLDGVRMPEQGGALLENVWPIAKQRIWGEWVKWKTMQKRADQY